MLSYRGTWILPVGATYDVKVMRLAHSVHLRRV